MLQWQRECPVPAESVHGQEDQRYLGREVPPATARLPRPSRTVALSALARGRQTNLGKISRIARWRLYSYEGAPGPMESNTDFFESKRTTSKHTPYLLLEHPPYRSDSAHLGSLQTHYPFRTWLLLRRH